MGIETVKKAVDINESETQEQFLSRVSEINGHIVRIYNELEHSDKSLQEIETSLKDQINRLAEYYEELYRRGSFVDEKTQRKKSLNEVCRTILGEMSKRDFSTWTKDRVWHSLDNKYKRAWRKPIVDEDGKLVSTSLLEIDNEVETLFDEQMNHIRSFNGFDYNELPKSLRLMVAEHFYKAYRRHEREWQKHGITVVKHEDGLNIPDPFEGIIRIEEGEPYEGELYDSIVSHKKTVSAFAKKIKTGIKDKDGNRIITLEQEHEYAMGVRSLDGYFLPSKNYKWKRDLVRWAGLLLKKFELKSKSGAEKFSREPVSRNFYDFKTMFKEDPERGITREEIAKMQRRVCIFFLQFIKHHPGLLALADIFVNVSEEKRAAHSIKMNAKLSDRA
ncbi:hypothetical protein [Glutamicibacter sp.]|uniref:hypothetical protein n=1 Tax=Glutamicibacter sp. TaxID=1931995 RepID=UPI002B48D45D|nr:hypothetical protein [Glutamicibacter sp.]HJX79200.1 hypothetical protein [Glutamicibacter sp.]